MIQTIIRAFIITTGLTFALIVCYLTYQESYPLSMLQESYYTKNNEQFHHNTANMSTTKNRDAHQASPSQGGRSNFIPAPLERPRPSVVPVTSDNENCLPIFKNPSIKAIPEDDCDQPHITINPGGRLGNKICQYASLHLLRDLYGVRVSIRKPMKIVLSNVMKNIVLPLEDSTCFTNRTKRIQYNDMYMSLYETTIQAKTNATGNTVMKPLLNASYYVLNAAAPRFLLLSHRDLVRSFLTFRDEVVKQATDNIDKALKEFNATYHNRSFPVVTVHVRRTDYTRYIKGKYELTQLDDFYFKRAFEFYKARLKDPVFLVISDDPAWCRRTLLAKDVMIIASASPPVDMAVMSLGDHHVTSYGTYSLSGAMLGHGHITHPIGHNNKYNLYDCIDLPFFHRISRDPTYEVDNANVVLS